MKTHAAVIAGLAAFAAAMLLPDTASADASSAFSAKQLAAFGRVTSLRVNVRNSAMTVDAVTTRRPAAVALVVHQGDNITEMRRVGGVDYMRAGGAWNIIPPEMTPDAAMADPVTELAAAHVTLLPDRVVNGVTLGLERIVASADSALPGGDREMVCTYDKGTLLLRTCAASAATLRFSHYNDPANRIAVPAGAQKMGI